MNITDDRVYMVFRQDGEYGPIYSLGLSKKKENGGYENGYINVRFRKGIQVANKTKIVLKQAWITFKKKDKKTYPYVFINDFVEANKIDQSIEKMTDTEILQKATEEDAFKEFSEEISDIEFPFER